MLGSNPKKTLLVDFVVSYQFILVKSSLNLVYFKIKIGTVKKCLLFVKPPLPWGVGVRQTQTTFHSGTFAELISLFNYVLKRFINVMIHSPLILSDF